MKAMASKVALTLLLKLSAACSNSNSAFSFRALNACFHPPRAAVTADKKETICRWLSAVGGSAASNFTRESSASVKASAFLSNSSDRCSSGNGPCAKLRTLQERTARKLHPRPRKDRSVRQGAHLHGHVFELPHRLDFFCEGLGLTAGQPLSKAVEERRHSSLESRSLLPIHLGSCLCAPTMLQKCSDRLAHSDWPGAILCLLHALQEPGHCGWLAPALPPPPSAQRIFSSLRPCSAATSGMNSPRCLCAARLPPFHKLMQG